MLIRSRAWVRTRTAVLAFTALLLAGASRGQAEQAECLDAKMMEAVKVLVVEPTPANFQAVRAILATESGYNPFSDDLERLDKLVQAGKYYEALNFYARSLSNLVLSVRAHYLASEAAAEVGNKTFADMEMRFAVNCLDSILATGDGSASKPFVAVRLSDEADVLKTRFHTAIDGEELVFRGDKPCTKVLGKDGRAYWFDVSMIFNHGKAIEARPAAKATPHAGSKVVSAAPAVKAEKSEGK